MIQTIRARFHVSRSAAYRGFQRVYRLDVGTRRGSFALGAGYIGGFTVYFGLNSVRSGGVDAYRPRRFRAGITRNANRVPHTQG